MAPVAKPNPWRVIGFMLALAIAPVLLNAWIGAPIPRSLPTADQIETLLRGLTLAHWHALLRIIVWAAWLAVLAGSIWEIAAYLRTRNRPAPAAKPWFLRLTGALALGTTATSAMTAAPVAAAEPDSAEDTETETTTIKQSTTDESASSKNTAMSAHPASSGRNDSRDYVVHVDDNLSLIAKNELGSANKWTTVYEDNKNKPQPDGGRLTDPDLIQPGWVLSLDGSGDDPAPESKPLDDEQPPHGFAPPQLDDTPAPDDTKPEHTDEATKQESGWMWWAGGFISSALAAGLAMHVHRTRRRARECEDRTGKSGPRVRLPKPLDELEALATSEPADVDLDEPPAIGLNTDGTAVPVIAAASGGLGLAGPGAEAVTRAAIAAALIDDDQDAASHGCDVLISRGAFSQLLDDDEPPDKGIYRLWTHPDCDATLRKLSREILARIREPETVNTPVLAVLDDDADRAVLASLMRQADHLDIGVLILGDWPDNTTTINADGTSDNPDLAQCGFLTTEAFTAILSTLDDVREADDEANSPPADVDDKPEPNNLAAGEPDTASSDAPAEHPETGSPLRLRLLGNFELTLRGEPVHIRRTKSRELLACLAAQDHAASRNYLLEAIVAETVVPKARNHLESIVTNTRKDLREATGDRGTKFIVYTDNTYRLDPDWFTTDLAEFDQHLADAAAAGDHTVALTHLAAALELYSDEVAADIDADSIWPHPIRAHYADLAHNACLTLAQHAADLHEHDTATAWLERAIDINRFHEDAYARLIRIHQDHGDNDNAASVYRRLKSALAAIGAIPNPASRPQVAQPTTVPPAN